MSPPLKKHLELERVFKMLRDADKLRRLLQIKQRQKEEATYIEETHKGWLQRDLPCL
jgi:hypothetical protein